MRFSETIIWDQEEVLSPLMQTEPARLTTGALLINPTKPRAAETCPTDKTEDYTQPQPTAGHLRGN